AKVLRDGKTAKARARAATALGQTYSKAAIPALTVALKDNAFEVRYAAAIALVLVDRYTPSAAVPVLIEAMGSERKEVRWEAAYHIRLAPAVGRPALPRLKELTRDPER